MIKIPFDKNKLLDILERELRDKKVEKDLSFFLMEKFLEAGGDFVVYNENITYTVSVRLLANKYSTVLDTYYIDILAEYEKKNYNLCCTFYLDEVAKICLYFLRNYSLSRYSSFSFSLEGIRSSKAIRGVYNPNNNVYRVTLIDYKDKHRNQLAQERFKNQCEINGVPIKRKIRYSSDMYLYRVSLNSLYEMEMVRGFEGVLSVEEVTPICVSLDA